MFSYNCRFFSLPSKEQLFKVLAEGLAMVVCIETATEITLAASGGGLLPSVLVPYLPILAGIMAGIQSDLLLEGNELKANAKRFCNWLSQKFYGNDENAVHPPQ